MGNLAVMNSKQIYGDTVNNFGIQREKNKTHGDGNVGQIQQSEIGKGGDRNTYQRKF